MTTYRELVIAGNYNLVRGYSTGFQRGRGWEEAPVFARESGIRRIGLGERFLNWMGMEEHLAHVIVDDKIADDLAREITASLKQFRVKVVSRRRIKSATFEFQYQVFAKVYGEEVKAIFAAVPADVKVDYHEGPEEKVKPEAQGIEMYAPEHDYELSARGVASGDFGLAFPFFRKLADHPLVEVDELILEYYE